MARISRVKYHLAMGANRNSIIALMHRRNPRLTYDEIVARLLSHRLRRY